MALEIPTPQDLKRLRLAAGLTQKELARLAGVSQSLIARIEVGSVDPRLSTLRRILNAIPLAASMKTVREVMHSPVISIGSRETIRKAVELMERYGISQLPVIDNGRVVGSVQENSLVREISRSKDPAALFDKPVLDVMEDAFPIVTPSASIGEVLSLFSYGKPAILVVDKGKIVGIITKIDVITSIKARE